MAATRRAKESPDTIFQVGSRVSFVMGGRRVRGTIIEDRGNIGFRGSRLFTVRVKRSPEDVILELPAEDLKAA